MLSEAERAVLRQLDYCERITKGPHLAIAVVSVPTAWTCAARDGLVKPDHDHVDVAELAARGLVVRRHIGWDRYTWRLSQAGRDALAAPG